MNKVFHSPVKTPAVPASGRPKHGRPFFSLRKIGQTCQYLSLDVALGAVVSSAMVCRLMHVNPIPWVQLLILGGVVLLIYTLDHLWDVRRMTEMPVTARHFFHWRYERELWWFACILFAALCITAITLLTTSVIYFGVFLGSTVAVYLWIVNHLPADKVNKWFLKELYIAVLYTAGIWGSVGVQAVDIQPIHGLLAFLFGLTALLNLLLFSCYELKEDTIQAQHSVVITWGKRTVVTGCICLFVVFGVTATLLACSHMPDAEEKVLTIEIAMAVVLLLLFLFPAFFKKGYRYRWIGDGIFLLPVLVFIF